MSQAPWTLKHPKGFTDQAGSIGKKLCVPTARGLRMEGSMSVKKSVKNLSTFGHDGRCTVEDNTD